jgi:hypothetical protein
MNREEGSPCAGHEILSFWPWRNEKLSLRTSDLTCSWFDLALHWSFLGHLLLWCFLSPSSGSLKDTTSPTSYWLRHDSTPSCTSCPISMSTSKSHSLRQAYDCSSV